jgi:hypothetical protein
MQLKYHVALIGFDVEDAAFLPDLGVCRTHQVCAQHGRRQARKWLSPCGLATS